MTVQELATPAGTVVTLEDDGSEAGLVVYMENSDGESDEVGRVIADAFQPCLFPFYSLSPDALRAVAQLIEQHSTLKGAGSDE